MHDHLYRALIEVYFALAEHEAEPGSGGAEPDDVVRARMMVVKSNLELLVQTAGEKKAQRPAETQTLTYPRLHAVGGRLS